MVCVWIEHSFGRVADYCTQMPSKVEIEKFCTIIYTSIVHQHAELADLVDVLAVDFDNGR